MKHPLPEEWIPYLYGECEDEKAAQMKEHLEQCPECEARLEKWRGVQEELGGWKIPQAPARKRRAPEYLKWAAAAVIFSAAGFGAGRNTANSQMETAIHRAVDEKMAAWPGAASIPSNQLAAAISTELARQVYPVMERLENNNRAALNQWIGVMQRTREEDQKSTLAVLTEVSNRQVSQLAQLRKDLETVAASTDDELRLSRQRFLQLSFNEK